MSDIIDKLVEGAGQVISEVDKGGPVQSAISGLRTRMAEADRRRKINQVKQQIRDLQAQEAQTINALSAQVLALHEAGSLTQPELVSLCRGVDEIRVQIKEQEAELAKIEPPPARSRHGSRRSISGHGSYCNIHRRDPPARSAVTVVVAGAAFCQTCGAAQAPQKKPRRCCSASTAAPNCARGHVLSQVRPDGTRKPRLARTFSWSGGFSRND